MHKSFLAAFAVAVVGLTAGASSALETISANITTDRVFTLANSPYILDKPIFVNSGATLTIEPGVVVRGLPRTGAVSPGVVAGTPGALIITQDGYANIAGSATAPIVMTTAAVDNNADGDPDDLDGNGFLDAYPGFNPADCPGACALPGLGVFYDSDPTSNPLAPLSASGDANVSLWGGLVILGNAPSNLADGSVPDTEYGQGTIEGLQVPGFPAADATYCGSEPHDSSGIFTYVSVRHAGDEIGNGNELNGVTLGCVGDATVFENIEVYCNFDDGIEWFGGTVGGKNLAVFFAGDDSFDIDQGYTGVNQYLVAVMPFFNQNSGAVFGSGSGDKGAELDGDDRKRDGSPTPPPNVNVRINDTFTATTAFPEAWPQSGAALYNFTLVGSTLPASPDFTPVSAASVNRGIQMRQGFAGTVLNTVVINTGSRAGLEIDDDAGEGYPDVTFNVGRDTVRLVSSTLHDGAAPANCANCAQQAIDNGDAAVPAQYNASGTANAINPSSFSLVQEDVSFDPTGGGTGKLSGSAKADVGGSLVDLRIDLAASDDAAEAGGVTTGPDPAGATFRGAYSQTGPSWTAGWTALSQGGVLR